MLVHIGAVMSIYAPKSCFNRAGLSYLKLYSSGSTNGIRVMTKADTESPLHYRR
ncbi:hypothetical protein APHWI1_1128 [Anaplasma phagocytophilum str. ApWI1]|uniref:Uncharacterized protein n=1 Tax=Anaplasma phagocytophilum str. ApWI1 TaxID=1359155 RepID=A0A0F3PZ00_ANAPH|nr:hypothetical protein APHWEB_0386 [Anaplasma phagocytophilum str. Webster]KJV82270.1 hypothetical protein APHHGE2_0354 [Anaplasma phagocytophilum str. HGE2]KJV84429.1 hypothetical protein APHWI1_1128 [Anaplasma phagocytophilum str. ApWI1]KJV88474.1 hypothetical protein APHNYW_0081 [Anaplasma phagocytophilum str. ApNYW]KJV99759.1 hypothetical protein OTSANNIE_0307 [Anaplasma phagocytophilum str. Annie]KJZ99439.1 hypothetical protein APHCR_1086 [Anaplasma phagocytophilum str. CR1007]